MKKLGENHPIWIIIWAGMSAIALVNVNDIGSVFPNPEFYSVMFYVIFLVSLGFLIAHISVVFSEVFFKRFLKKDR